jgi:predicted DNA-binding transcriptional regulator AlpA
MKDEFIGIKLLAKKAGVSSRTVHRYFSNLKTDDPRRYKRLTKRASTDDQWSQVYYHEAESLKYIKELKKEQKRGKKPDFVKAEKTKINNQIELPPIGENIDINILDLKGKEAILESICRIFEKGIMSATEAANKLGLTKSEFWRLINSSAKLQEKWRGTVDHWHATNGIFIEHYIYKRIKEMLTTTQTKKVVTQFRFIPDLDTGFTKAVPISKSEFVIDFIPDASSILIAIRELEKIKTMFQIINIEEEIDVSDKI